MPTASPTTKPSAPTTACRNNERRLGVVPKYDDENLRELIVYPYRLIYRLKSDRIDIIAVFHGAQQLPESL